LENTQEEPLEGTLIPGGHPPQFIYLSKALFTQKGTISQKSWRDKAMESKSGLQLRITTGFFMIFMIGPLIPVIFKSFHFA
jgi:hypothetical protein